MTEIKVDPDQLKELADGIQKSEDKVDDALGKLSWTFSSFLVGITQANTGRIKDVQAELEHHMKKYQSKLDELQEGVMLTRAQILEADKNGWDKTGEFGLELLGVYDAERIFAEYDPVTGKKITGWQRAMATGMTLATLFPPAKGVVLLGKMGVKGLKALKLIENGAEVIKQTKNVLNPAVLKKMAQASYNTVIKGPIAKTSAYLKKAAENVKNIELSLNFNVFGQANRLDPVLEGVGHVPGKTVGEITEGIGKSAREMVGKAKDTIVRFSGKGKGKVETTVKSQTPNQRKSDVIQNNFVEITSRTNIYNPKDIPSVRDGEFIRWFDNITLDELEIAWANPEVKKVISARLRSPGKLHEWLMVARAPTFKRWGISAKQIQKLRTPTKDVEFINPPGKHHRAPGSKRAHNEILEIIDTSLDYDTFVRRLQMWSHYRYKGGVEGLPGTLKK
ncbi:pre-toxin TG domain-containing protein [Rossellomorea marisflavi]|uniref:pre-toxin TG domain-containing protein n=1 Tax=Rossellomorea marisflavi TaxID=189381 RepID=UPI00064F6EF8|nr:pre-toxin TG domain-containing protein [Rossellomorea marisflavi]KML32064.1 hypothetical protein VL12_17305 [Rossellomorea marisflavi]